MTYFIDEDEVKRALLLIRDLRYRTYQDDINPLAMRIALKVALYIDDIEANRKLKPEQEAMLEKHARNLIRSSKNGALPPWIL